MDNLDMLHTDVPWSQKTAAMQQRTSDLVANRLLRPTGTVPASVAKVIDDLSQVATLVYSKRHGGPHDFAFNCWSDVLSFLRSSTNWLPLELNNILRPLTDSFPEDDIETVIADRLPSGIVQHKQSSDTSGELYEWDTETDIQEMAFMVIDMHLSYAAQALVAGHPTGKPDATEFPLGVPVADFHIWFADESLRVFESGLWPVGWVWDSETTGRFIAYTPDSSVVSPTM